MLLSLPTCWAVVKAINRIRTGKRPSPTERIEENFFEEGKIAGRQQQKDFGRQERRAKRRTKDRRTYTPASDSSSEAEGVPLRTRRGQSGSARMYP